MAQSKILAYANLISLKKIRETSKHTQMPSNSLFKALRTLCLLLKAFTCMNAEHRQIKDDEMFTEWDKVQ